MTITIKAIDEAKAAEAAAAIIKSDHLKNKISATANGSQVTVEITGDPQAVIRGCRPLEKERYDEGLIRNIRSYVQRHSEFFGNNDIQIS